MSAIHQRPITSSRDTTGFMLRVAVVVLALVTAYFHATLGSLMFLANALGYLVLATGMAVPMAIVARYRWLVRAALLGFTLVTIVAWVVFGGRFMLAYVDKAVEVALVAALLIEMWRYDGGPVKVLRRLVDLGGAILRLPFTDRDGA